MELGDWERIQHGTLVTAHIHRDTQPESGPRHDRTACAAPWDMARYAVLEELSHALCHLPPVLQKAATWQFLTHFAGPHLSCSELGGGFTL